VSSLAGLLVGLFLPGLGWSCGLVAGSTMVTEAVPADLRPTAQGPLPAVGGFGLVAVVAGVPVLPLAGVWVGSRRLLQAAGGR
jgi:hypothetical protein